MLPRPIPNTHGPLTPPCKIGNKKWRACLLCLFSGLPQPTSLQIQCQNEGIQASLTFFNIAPPVLRRPSKTLQGCGVWWSVVEGSGGLWSVVEGSGGLRLWSAAQVEGFTTEPLPSTCNWPKGFSGSQAPATFPALYAPHNPTQASPRSVTTLHDTSRDIQNGCREQGSVAGT